MEKNSIKEMLQTDIGLKLTLGQLLKNFSRRQILSIILITICTVATVIVFIFYFTRPTKSDVLVYQAIQKERNALRMEREIIRREKDSLVSLIEFIKTIKHPCP